ncbi:calretinin-like isoform X1 [Symsagittifera roscoffensis]|uniref:calretinin-like isoform X1 n=1 Tax=Symsagittifera roscoffensis TaxID=84072 RepID=UPI00307C019F
MEYLIDSYVSSDEEDSPVNSRKKGGMKNKKSDSFMEEFKHKAEITADEFWRIWNKFDEDGTGYLEGDEIKSFFKELITAGNDRAISEEALNEMIRTYMDAYDVDGDGRISISELGEILPVEENFLLLFQHEQELNSVQFMEIWREHDKDRNGFIDSNELKSFLHSVLKKKSAQVSKERLEEYAQTILQMFDSNNDGKLGLQEMARLLPVQENFLVQFQNKPNLTKEEFNTVFNHYDTDGNGVIQGDELAGFLKDLMEHENQDVAASELEEYRRVLLRICDLNRDGKLQKAELSMVLCMEMGKSMEDK